MIDYENEIYTAVRAAVVEEFPDVYLTTEYKRIPPTLPCVFFTETDNAAYRSTQDSGSMENHALVTYDVEIYSNRSTGKKTEAKAIAGVVDGAMDRLGFTRIMKNPVPNYNDATIYRILARYRAVIGKDGTIYGQ